MVAEVNPSWIVSYISAIAGDALRTGRDDEVRGHCAGSIVYVDKGMSSVDELPYALGLVRQVHDKQLGNGSAT